MCESPREVFHGNDSIGFGSGSGFGICTALYLVRAVIADSFSGYIYVCTRGTSRCAAALVRVSYYLRYMSLLADFRILGSQDRCQSFMNLG